MVVTDDQLPSQLHSVVSHSQPIEELTLASSSSSSSSSPSPSSCPFTSSSTHVNVLPTSVCSLTGSDQAGSIMSTSSNLRDFPPCPSIGKNGNNSLLPNTGQASIFSSAFNMACNLIGSGMLAMSWSLKESSLFSGLIILILMCLCNGCTMIMLAKACEYAKSFNYQILGSRSLGRPMGLTIQIFMLFYTFSSCLSYVILIGDFVPTSVTAARPDRFGLSQEKLRLYVIIIMGGCILLPLSFIKNLHSLRFTSVISILSILYTCFLVCFSLGGHVRPIRSDVKLWSFNVCTFTSISLMNIAFTAHYNGPRFYQELKDRSIPRFTRAVCGAMAAALTIYTIMAVAGYLRFGNDTLGDILNNFATDDTMAIIARLALAIGVSFSFPLCFHAIRTSVFTLISPELLQPSNQVFTNVKYVLLTIFLVGLNILLGIVLTQIEVVMVYKGSIFGSGVVYVFPAIMFLKLRAKYFRHRREVKRKETMRKDRLEEIDAQLNDNENSEIFPIKISTQHAAQITTTSLKLPLLTCDHNDSSTIDINPTRLPSQPRQSSLPASSSYIIASSALSPATNSRLRVAAALEEAAGRIALDYDEHSTMFSSPLTAQSYLNAEEASEFRRQSMSGPCIDHTSDHIEDHLILPSPNKTVLSASPSLVDRPDSSSTGADLIDISDHSAIHGFSLNSLPDSCCFQPSRTNDRGLWSTIFSCFHPKQAGVSSSLSERSSSSLRSGSSTSILDSSWFASFTAIILIWGFILGIVGLTVNILVQTGSLHQCQT